tara:strand:+ start:525 stop:677 length:153 start_codon:yes stop_codon:yes gene_type:complete
MLRFVSKKVIKRPPKHTVPPHIMAEKEEKELIERDKEKPTKKFTVWYGKY